MVQAVKSVDFMSLIVTIIKNVFHSKDTATAKKTALINPTNRHAVSDK